MALLLAASALRPEAKHKLNASDLYRIGLKRFWGEIGFTREGRYPRGKRRV